MRPLRIVDGLVRNLKCDGLPPELEKRAGSLALIALTLLRDAVDLSVRDERTLLYNRLAADSIEVLAAADSEVTAIYLEGLVPRQRFEYWIGETGDCRDALTSGDPLADVENELSLDFIVTRPGPRMLHLMGRLSNPAQRALEVIGQVEDSTGLAVWASNARGDWGLVVWQKPDLVTVSNQGDRRIRWIHQRLTGLVGPASLAAQTWMGDSQTIYEVVSTPRFRQTEAAAAVLGSVGITEPSPPTGWSPR